MQVLPYAIAIAGVPFGLIGCGSTTTTTTTTNIPALPLYRIIASSPRDAGERHGRLAKDQIQGWFATQEMQHLFNWTAGNGSKAFQQLKADNAKEFPAYVAEMQGIADGAGVTMDQVWVANMINELENLMSIAGFMSTISSGSGMHCSDIYAVKDGGYTNSFAHGHNDDWSATARKFWYLTAYSFTNAGDTPGFKHCAGVTYPATLVGWAPTWNEHGIFATQNTLVPKKSRPGGLACAFVQRRAICPSRSMEEVVWGLSRPGWSDGASLNIVDVRGKKMANVEVWENRSSVVYAG